MGRVIRPPAAPPRKGDPAPGAPIELERILGLEVELTVVLADRKMPVRDVAKLRSGDMIEFEKPATDPLVLTAGGRDLGLGKAVKAEERFGFKVADIGKPTDIVRKLGGKS